LSLETKFPFSVDLETLDRFCAVGRFFMPRRGSGGERREPSSFPVGALNRSARRTSDRRKFFAFFLLFFYFLANLPGAAAFRVVLYIKGGAERTAKRRRILK
jgi:hypothetical protein